MTIPSRTIKLLIALCKCRYIVSSKWIIESALAGHFLPEENYRLDFSKVEETFNCNIYTVFDSPLRRTLFDGKVFYISPQVKPHVGDCRSLIEMCGGVVEKTLRTVRKVREQNIERPESYLIVTCVEDRLLIQPYIKQKVCAIVTTEYIMQSIMQQSINAEPHIIKWDIGEK
jgi:PAX-interacting protein 1